MRIQGAALILLLLAATGSHAAQTATPDDLLQRGQANYRSGHYAEAVTDLRAASDALLTPEQMRAYVNSGKFDSLPKFETAVIYLAMAYAKLGRDAEAGEQIHRLNVAEAIAPVYAKLPLTEDVADFEKVAARIAPNANLPKNAALAALRPSAQAPIEVAQAQPAPKPAPAPAVADDRAAQERIIAERVAVERAAIEKDAQQRIAAAQEEAQKTIEQRVAEERAAIQKAADERIAAERAAAMKAADEKIAAARAAMEQEIAAVRATAQPSTTVQAAAPQQSGDATVRQADAFAASGDADQANALYNRIIDSPNASRESIIAAATGLYRTGDFAGAVRGFQRLPNFLRGEEDLRYYNAVALYETGHYEQARKELACALPYIQTTDDVARYRAKIEQTANQPSM